MTERRLSKPLTFGNSPQSSKSDGNATENKLSEEIEITHVSREGEAKVNNGEARPDMKIGRFLKTMDANRYATKKTLAQGMLDIALLTTNASQLKYVLQVGQRHEFYTLMLYLISASIGLQILQGVIIVFLGSGLNINHEQDQRKANRLNDICMSLMVVTVAVNVIISTFEMRDIDLLVESVSKGDGKELARA